MSISTYCRKTKRQHLHNVSRSLVIKETHFGGVCRITSVTDTLTCLWDSSTGVQVGGLRASYGALGSWTTVSHDNDDPAGTFSDIILHSMRQSQVSIFCFVPAGPFWLRKQHAGVDVPMNHVSLNSVVT